MAALSPDQWLALSPYLDEALTMADEDLLAWLSSLRTQNPDLAAQLEVLLREHRSLSEEGFLEERSVGLPAGPGLAGQEVGVYTIDLADRPGRHGQRLAGGTKRRTI